MEDLADYGCVIRNGWSQGAAAQNKFKTKGENPRTISRIVVRVDSIAQVLEVHKDAEGAVPTEQAVAPQPA